MFVIIISAVSITLSIVVYNKLNSYQSNQDKLKFSFRSIRKRLKENWARQSVIDESNMNLSKTVTQLAIQVQEQSARITELQLQLQTVSPFGLKKK